MNTIKYARRKEIPFHLSRSNQRVVLGNILAQLGDIISIANTGILSDTDKVAILHGLEEVKEFLENK